MRLLYFSKTSFIGPSSRYRIYQYIPYLQQAGIEITVCPLFREGWFRILDLPHGPLRIIAKALYSSSSLLVRIKDLLKVGSYDLYVLEHQAFPYLPAFLERVAKGINPNMVLEFDDAIFLTFLHGKKIPRLIQMSKHVIVGNNYLRDYALRFNPNVTVVPTVVDTGRYRPKENYRHKGRLIIGWVGLAYNLPYIKQLADILKRLKKEVGDFQFKVICSQPLKIEGLDVIFKPWSYDEEVEDIRGFDIGIMPLADDEWAKGKCGLKVLQYMACGVPVIASAVGVNSEIIRDGENGFLAKSDDEWLEKLTLLIRDENLRRELGQKGRRTVEDSYCLSLWGPRLAELYRKLMNIPGDPQIS